MITEEGKEVKAEFQDNSSRLHVGEGHSGSIHRVRRGGGERDLEYSFGETGFGITLRHPNADHQSAAGDPGYRGRSMKSKESHTTQCRFHLGANGESKGFQ